MGKLQPDAPIVIAETGRKCRMSLVARDNQNRFWGLTARHVLAGLDVARIRTPEGRLIGRYSARDDLPVFASTRAEGHIARFALEASAIDPDRIATGVTWPRAPIDEETVLGTAVVTSAPSAAPIGIVVAIDSVAPLASPEGQVFVEGSTIVELEDQSLLRPGLAGMLLTSPAGEAVGVAFAASRERGGATIVASPLVRFLDAHELRLWAPSGAHWSDLPRRTRNFVEEIEAQGLPDLGAPPRSGAAA
jgi:hypothetical protein